MIRLFDVEKVSLAASLLCAASRLPFGKEESKESVQSCILVAADAQSLHNTTVLLQVLTAHVFVIYQPLHL